MAFMEDLSKARGLDQEAMEKARRRWGQVAKPLYSLGILEEDVVQMAGILGSPKVCLDKKALVVMCGDNGVVEEGVSQASQEVTAIVAENFTRGDSCACIMAEQAGVEVFPVDLGVARDLVHVGSRYPLIREKIAYGTKNFSKEPAMSRKEATQAIQAGVDLVGRLKSEGYGLVATGEMGIGNTTTSSAVASVLLGLPPKELTGKGAGLSDQGLERKVQVICQAIGRWKPDAMDGIDVLSKVGGFDLAGLAGVCLGGVIYRVPILLDGFISGVAALAAVGICPLATGFLLASHVSGEPGGRLVLDALGLEPLIQARMRLGEGTGALCAVPLLAMALEVYGRMSAFQEIGVEPYQPL